MTTTLNLPGAAEGCFFLCCIERGSSSEITSPIGLSALAAALGTSAAFRVLFSDCG